MKRKQGLIWLAVIVLILLVGFFLINGQDEGSSTEGSNQEDTVGAEGQPSLETSDDVFSEIDSSLEAIG